MNRTTEFQELVNSDVRTSGSGQIDEAAEILRDIDNVHDWLDALLSMKIEVDFQLGAAKLRLENQAAQYAAGQITEETWVAALTAHNNWKISSLRFKAGVEVRIVEARSIIRDEEMFERDNWNTADQS